MFLSSTACRRLFQYGSKCRVISKKIRFSNKSRETAWGFVAGNYIGPYKISDIQLLLVSRLRLSLDKTIKFMYGDDLMTVMREYVQNVWVSTITWENKLQCISDVLGLYFLLWRGYTVSCWEKYEHWKIYFSIRWQSLACWTFFKSCFGQSQKIENDINISSWPAEPRSQYYRKCLENAQTKCTKTFKGNRNFNDLKRGVLDIWSAHPLH